jgi:hypothetical protein
VRELANSKDPRAAFAIDYFVYRVALHTGMLVAALGGLDAFVFTAGIGENSIMMRARLAEKLDWIGAKIDRAANAASKLLISEKESRVALYVIATDEELMIARHTLAVLSARAPIRSLPDVAQSARTKGKTWQPDVNVGRFVPSNRGRHVRRPSSWCVRKAPQSRT